jgi:hypothetical protein
VNFSIASLVLCCDLGRHGFPKRTGIASENKTPAEWVATRVAAITYVNCVRLPSIPSTYREPGCQNNWGQPSAFVFGEGPDDDGGTIFLIHLFQSRMSINPLNPYFELYLPISKLKQVVDFFENQGLDSSLRQQPYKL